MATQSTSDPAGRLALLLSELRNLKEKHDQAARSFEVSSGVGAVLFDLGLQWAEDALDISADTAREEAASLREKWTQSKPYGDLSTEFNDFLDHVKAELLSIFKHPTTYSRIHQARTLATKIRLLEARLLDDQDRIRNWLHAGRALPVGREPGRSRSGSGARRVARTRPATLVTKEWWQSTIGLVALLAVVGAAIYLAHLLGELDLPLLVTLWLAEIPIGLLVHFLTTSPRRGRNRAG